MHLLLRYNRIYYERIIIDYGYRSDFPGLWGTFKKIHVDALRRLQGGHRGQGQDIRKTFSHESIVSHRRFRDRPRPFDWDLFPTSVGFAPHSRQVTCEHGGDFGPHPSRAGIHFPSCATTAKRNMKDTESCSPFWLSFAQYS